MVIKILKFKYYQTFYITKIISNDIFLNYLKYLNILTKTIETWINYAKLLLLYNLGTEKEI